MLFWMLVLNFVAAHLLKNKAKVNHSKTWHDPHISSGRYKILNCLRMETTFTEKQLVDFGNYLLSEKRKKLMKQSIVAPNEAQKYVHHADLENWKAKQSEQ